MSNKKVISDSEMLDWLQEQMTNYNDYCEIFFAGLRNGPNNATAFQIESNPEKFSTSSGKTIREAIEKAINQNKK